MLALVLASVLGFGSAWASYSLPEYRLSTHVEQMELKDILWLEDPEGSFTEAEVMSQLRPQFKSTLGKTFSNGYKNSTWWLAFTVINTQVKRSDKDNNTWILELASPLVNSLQVYEYRGSDVIAHPDMGYSHPLVKRPITHQNFLLPITLKPQERRTILIRLNRPGGSLEAPLTIWTPGALVKNTNKTGYFIGLFFGGLLAIIIYNAFLNISTRDSTYLYYILYTSASLLTYLAITGYGYLFVWPEYPQLNKTMIPVCCSLAAATAIQFLRAFVKSKRNHPILDRYLFILAMAGILISVICLFSNTALGKLSTLYVLCCAVLATASTLYFWSQGSRQAGFFMIAWSLFLVSVILYCGTLIEMIPTNFFTRYSILIGSSVETLLLSLALADKINQERKSRISAIEKEQASAQRLHDVENQLIHNALHSSITGLPNRGLIKRALEQHFSEQGKTQPLALCLLSLDNIHEFNNTLGHSNGDAILRQIANRLRSHLKKFDNIMVIESIADSTYYMAHVDYTTLGFILDVDNAEDARMCAENIRVALNHSIEYQDIALDIETSIGISLYPEHGEAPSRLLRNGNIAIETAAQRADKLAIYSSSIDPYSERRLSLIGDLKTAIDTDSGLELYFQPQINIAQNTLSGAEALIRWIHDDHGFVSPDEFIPLAERTGVIHPLTQWVLRRAFMAHQALRDIGLDIPISINISARNLQDKSFCRNIDALASEMNVDRSKIILELTETSIMINPEEAKEELKAIHDMGVKISIDDFGTGYSSLSHLKRFPLDELKIDRSFIMEMINNADDQVIVATTIRMAQSLGLEVVAEGIENEEILAILSAHGCDYAQGYHFARPMPLDDFLAWARAHNAPVAHQSSAAG